MQSFSHQFLYHRPYHAMAQLIRMKELSRENRLDENVIYSIMKEEKANQKEKLSFKM